MAFVKKKEFVKSKQCENECLVVSSSISDCTAVFEKTYKIIVTSVCEYNDISFFGCKKLEKLQRFVKC